MGLMGELLLLLLLLRAGGGATMGSGKEERATATPSSKGPTRGDNDGTPWGRAPTFPSSGPRGECDVTPPRASTCPCSHLKGNTPTPPPSPPERHIPSGQSQGATHPT